ncbi:hypothetical protein BGZ54_005845 [Gamsiella multidivaricata]|nr:hypothetical protein BGZ54_005845 [Gamsiella multidivaricata]
MAKEKDANIDTLEVLLNPGLISTKLSALPEGQAHAHGRRLLQDLLSVGRFGIPALIPAEPASNNGYKADDRNLGHDDSGVQMMQLSERQDMLLGQACKVYHFASLSLDDIFDQVPVSNQLCLITAMIILSQQVVSPVSKTNSEAGSMVQREEPWDPLTLFQRWILRSRISGTESSGLDFGDLNMHAEVLAEKLMALNKLPSSERVQCAQCQISSELGQYYCWIEQYEQGLKYLTQCHLVHSEHSASSPGRSTCRLDVKRTVALSKLAKLATGASLADPKENLLNHVRRLETEQRYLDLVDEFKKDNSSRLLPYVWRQRLLSNVLNKSDMRSAAILAIANALYHLREPSQMMLEIPCSVFIYLRALPFESGDEADAYLSPSIFEDLMQIIVDIKETYITPCIQDVSRGKNSEDMVKAFVIEFCANVRHVLCYDAAWKSGLIDPSADDWRLVWDTYSFILSRNMSVTEDSINPPTPLSDTTEAVYKSKLAEVMDPQDLEDYFHAAKQDASSPAFAKIGQQLQKYSAWAQLGILADELEKRREARISNRIEQKVGAKADAIRRVVSTKAVQGAATSAATEMAESSTADETRMDVDDLLLDPETQEHVKKGKQAKEDEEKTLEICRLLTHYLSSYGALELNLQLRCLALCINGKQWDFLSGYGRAAAEVLDKSIHGEICQVYSILVPLCAILSRAQALGVDLKDITSASCLDAVFSSDLEPIQVTRMAAFDMIQGLMPNVARPIISGGHSSIAPHQQQPQFNQPGFNGANNSYHSRNRWNRRSVQEDGSVPSGPQIMEEDLGHAVILRLFGLVRLRGVIDIFGALLAGAVSSILPERAKLTLNEFGYYALFTTSMDSIASWIDPRVKIIAMLSNGDAGKAIEAVPGARQRFAKLLIQVYERQIQYESDTLTKKLGIEDNILTMHRFDPDTGLSTDKAHTVLFTTKAAAQITRYSLCLTDLYYLEGLHQDALASFLNACMIASKCFADLDRLDRRVWAVYMHGPLSAPPTGHSPSPPATMLHAIVPSQGGPIPGAMFGPTGEIVQPMPTYLTLSALSGMGGGLAVPEGQVGLALSSLSPPQAQVLELGGGAPHIPPPPPPLPPLPPGASCGPPMVAPIPSPVLNSAQVAVPSAFAVRAIESCIQLNEPLASVALQQFLPRIDYSQAFAAIQIAYEQGMLSWSGLLAGSSGATSSTVTGTPGNVSGAGMVPVSLTSSGVMGSSLPGQQPPVHLLSGTALGPSSIDSSGITASLRVQSSTSVFMPELTAIVDSVTRRRGSSVFMTGSHSPHAALSSSALGQNSNSTGTLSRAGNSLSRQQFLEAVFDMTLLEKISYLCKESKDELGLKKVQERISSHRMALDALPPFREQIRHLVEQGLLTQLWSNYARTG